MTTKARCGGKSRKALPPPFYSMTLKCFDCDAVEISDRPLLCGANGAALDNVNVYPYCRKH